MTVGSPEVVSVVSKRSADLVKDTHNPTVLTVSRPCPLPPPHQNTHTPTHLFMCVFLSFNNPIGMSARLRVPFSRFVDSVAFPPPV